MPASSTPRKPKSPKEPTVVIKFNDGLTRASDSRAVADAAQLNMLLAWLLPLGSDCSLKSFRVYYDADRLGCTLVLEAKPNGFNELATALLTSLRGWDISRPHS